MPVQVALDGFGGVSRNLLTALQAGGFSDLFEVQIIAEQFGAAAVARRLEHDSLYGKSSLAISAGAEDVEVNGRRIAVWTSPALDETSWSEAGIDVVVVDGRGPTSEERAKTHLERGAKKVVMAGRGFEGARTVVVGLSDGSYDPDADQIISTGSAGLNALAPLALIVHKGFGIARGSVTVVHPLSVEQPLFDGVGTNLVDARSALTNIVPRHRSLTTDELVSILPSVDGKLEASEVHIPLAPVGWLALSVETERRFDASDVLAALTEASDSEAFVGVMGLVDGPVLSSDFEGDARSVIVSRDDVSMIGRAFVSIRGWFDAEWSLACRTVDVLALVCEAGVPGTA